MLIKIVSLWSCYCLTADFSAESFKKGIPMSPIKEEMTLNLRCFCILFLTVKKKVLNYSWKEVSTKTFKANWNCYNKTNSKTLSACVLLRILNIKCKL